MQRLSDEAKGKGSEMASGARTVVMRSPILPLKPPAKPQKPPEQESEQCIQLRGSCSGGWSWFAGHPEGHLLILACAWGPGLAFPGRPREEAAASESPGSCKNIRHPAAPCGLSPSGNTAPGAPPRCFPTASRSLFPQLFLQGHRRRVGGKGRQRGGHVGFGSLGGGGRELPWLRVQCVPGLSGPQDCLR